LTAPVADGGDPCYAPGMSVSEATAKWVEEQNKVTYAYLNQIPYRAKIKERLEQLCDYTAMTRIRTEQKQYRPDRAVANAMAEPKASGDTLEVTGGAFRSRKKWYALSYRCTSTPDRMSVVAFHFTVGDEIPQAKWSAYGLWD